MDLRVLSDLYAKSLPVLDCLLTLLWRKNPKNRRNELCELGVLVNRVDVRQYTVAEAINE